MISVEQDISGTQVHGGLVAFVSGEATNHNCALGGPEAVVQTTSSLRTG